jgi:hypothetical protein
MRAGFILAGLLLFIAFVQADVIECDNGDRYHGKVISMDDKKVVLKNDITGTLNIPRARIVSLAFREHATTPAAAKAVGAPVTAPASPAKQLESTSAIQQVQNDYLSGASPEANRMYNEMVQSLMSGQMNMADLRSKAQTTLQELKSLQKELGDDETAQLLNSYGAILESFLKQAPAQTNAVPRVIAP